MATAQKKLLSVDYKINAAEGWFLSAWEQVCRHRSPYQMLRPSQNREDLYLPYFGTAKGRGKGCLADFVFVLPEGSKFSGVAVEIDGGFYTQSMGHSSIAGRQRDSLKDITAIGNNWKVIRIPHPCKDPNLYLSKLHTILVQALLAQGALGQGALGQGALGQGALGQIDP